ncbi:nuclear polyadenylated RNA-binding protein 3-like [Asparagus officinalis]|uniref:nuclear polyadenylated RNA-binding protein 3-like n=1 Tax=Asparagus officinalis TaxID=4686 RepID=UPI00098E3BCE|nr:nuclear polyadenylated RNA-binding protein 3-like [Asparagus officinalis]
MYTSQPTISSIPSASRHQPVLREFLSKNREEYDELIELEKKLISGGNCGNEYEDETEGEEQEQDDGEDEEDGDDPNDGEDGGDTNDGEDDDDSNTNVGGNVIEDDEGNGGEQGEQSHEEMGKDEERSEKKSGGSKSKRKEKQPEMIAEELIEDDDFLPISFSRTSVRDIKDRTPSSKRVIRDRKHVPARARRSPYTQLRGRGRHEKKKEITNVSQLQTPGCDEKNEVIDVSQLQMPEKRRNVNSETDFIPKNCDYPAKGKLNESERKVLDEFCKKRMSMYNLSHTCDFAL